MIVMSRSLLGFGCRIIVGMILFWGKAGLAYSPANPLPASPLRDGLICGDFPNLTPGENTTENGGGSPRDSRFRSGGLVDG